MSDSISRSVFAGFTLLLVGLFDLAIHPEYAVHDLALSLGAFTTAGIFALAHHFNRSA